MQSDSKQRAGGAELVAAAESDSEGDEMEQEGAEQLDGAAAAEEMDCDGSRDGGSPAEASAAAAAAVQVGGPPLPAQQSRGAEAPAALTAAQRLRAADAAADEIAAARAAGSSPGVLALREIERRVAARLALGNAGELPGGLMALASAEPKARVTPTRHSCLTFVETAILQYAP